MSRVEINGLEERLIKLFNKKGIEYARKRARLFYSKLKQIREQWLKDIRTRMSRPASSRGFTNGRLNPHNSMTHNDGLPMLVSGKLKSMLRLKIEIKDDKLGSLIIINRKFNRALNKNGNDYGEILNQGGKNNRNRVLLGYKSRVYAILDERIRGIIK